jgi:hypothetical protein
MVMVHVFLVLAGVCALLAILLWIAGRRSSVLQLVPCGEPRQLHKQ